ncbi:hypothetical protein SLNSH_24045 [Alsobacter soli]|uniref:Uncharacterized protein n=1 Tax=Alsobacter soli TaxID=2109933 RepID=A0A2T1HLC7_9HYPH|nr:hypothetical protein SLNSH_24045 [Alsobacter soli]
MSAPAPPTRVSSPPPPSRVSSPAPPLMTLAPTLPRMLSARPEPTTFSMPDRMSPAASPPDWAVERLRLTVTPALEAE